MKKAYCGACRGERGCVGCDTAAKEARYIGLTEFFCAEEQKDAFVATELLLAADLGTTTLAFVCADADGTVLASYGAENPQRTVAADVIGRMDAALHGQRESLTNEIKEALAKGFLFVLERGISRLREQDDAVLPEKVRLAIAGNTTMEHLLLGYPLEGMARAPFTPYSTELTEVLFAELFRETKVYASVPMFLKEAKITIFPCFSAFVGGDLVAGACALKETKAEEPYLLMDLGTNGECLLFANGQIYGTAAAMGSAFEGGRFAYASDLFRLVTKARRAGVLDETGLLCEPYFSEGFEGLLQEDVREFQLAKGALRAGLELLSRYTGVEFAEVKQVYLAGGFGQFCEEDDLFGAGLLPEVWRGRVRIVGNSCIGGLLAYLKNKESVLYWKGSMLNLAEQPEFEELYYRFMNFEE